MEVITERQFYQILEGQRRGDVGPFETVKWLEGSDTVREYQDGDEPVAQIRVVDSESDQVGDTLDREYQGDPDVLAAVAYIYIPTTEEAELWDADESNDFDYEAEVAKREQL